MVFFFSLEMIMVEIFKPYGAPSNLSIYTPVCAGFAFLTGGIYGILCTLKLSRVMVGKPPDISILIYIILLIVLYVTYYYMTPPFQFIIPRSAIYPAIILALYVLNDLQAPDMIPDRAIHVCAIVLFVFCIMNDTKIPLLQ